MANKKKGKLGSWISKIVAGNATVNIHGKTKAAAKRNATAFKKKYMKNVEQGFYAGGIFHPIRASRDYSSARAGEGRSSKARRSRATKATRKRAMSR